MWHYSFFKINFSFHYVDPARRYLVLRILGHSGMCDLFLGLLLLCDFGSYEKMVAAIENI